MTAPAPATQAASDEPLPVVRASETAVARARDLYAGGHLRDALRVLDRVDTADPLRAEADRLRADIQRDLLAAAGIATPGPGRARCAAVKCPKCNYLGFETGDRCKNCGYDFSLISEPEISIDPDLDIDLALRASDDTLPATVQWDDKFEHMDADALAETAALAESPATREIADPDPEPLRDRAVALEPAEAGPTPVSTAGCRRFGAASLFDDSDEPLIKLPAAPRAPLAVRRTPETPRLRAVPRPVPKPSRPIDASPALDFVEDCRRLPSLNRCADARARTATRLAASRRRSCRACGGQRRRWRVSRRRRSITSFLPPSTLQWCISRFG